MDSLLRRQGFRAERGVAIPLPHQKSCLGCGEQMTVGTAVVRESDGEVREYLFDHEATCPYFRREYEKRGRLVSRDSLIGMYQHGVGRSVGGLPKPSRNPNTGRDIVTLDDWEQEFKGSWETTSKTHNGAHSVARRFLKKVASGTLPSSGFCLSGIVGAGKSCLMQALARDCIAAYVNAGLPTGLKSPVQWWLEQDLQERATSYFDTRDAEGEAEFLKGLQTVPILFIDNLGGQAANEWWLDSFLFKVVQARYEQRKPMLFTCKYSVERLREEWSRGSKGIKPRTVDDLLDRFGEVCPWAPIPITKSLRRLSVDF